MAQTTNNNIPEATLEPLPPKLRRPPFWMIAGFMVMTIATWVPLVLFARGRTRTSDEPRIAIMQDMGSQPKYREQQSSDVFADGRADRPRLEDTVARGGLHDDDFYDHGFRDEAFAEGKSPDGKPNGKFFEGFPPQVKVDEQLLRRGQERFNIYCSVCHGHDGYGQGPVNQRAMQLNELPDAGTKWTKAASLHQDNVRARPNGHIYNTINVGIRNMPGYGWQVAADDRWAIVAYVRALQLSQSSPPNLAAKEMIDVVSQK